MLLFYNAITGLLFWAIAKLPAAKRIAVQYCRNPMGKVSRKKSQSIRFYLQFDDY